MSKDNRKNRSISFNMLDPEEVELLAHAEQINPLTGKKRNFSKYIKRLIEEDLRREKHGGNNNTGGFTIIDHQNDEDENYTLDVKNAMNSFL